MVSLAFKPMFNVPIYESENTLEIVKGRSEVIPNQALSIREIIQRSNRGQLLAEVQGNQLQYGDDEDPDGEDFFEYDDDKFDQRDKLSYLEQRLQEAKAADEEYKKKKEEEAKINQADESDSSKDLA